MNQPYSKFASALVGLRRSYHTTRKELCMALEIDDEYLLLLESGIEQPSEDLVEQMIGLFSLDAKLADNLWVLAGYPPAGLEDLQSVQIAQLPLNELKASYTDTVHISVNNYGVTLSFMQNIAPGGHPIVVSRLGMSKEHARSVADIIYKTLASAEKQKPSALAQKSLPAPKTDKGSTN